MEPKDTLSRPHQPPSSRGGHQRGVNGPPRTSGTTNTTTSSSTSSRQKAPESSNDCRITFNIPLEAAKRLQEKLQQAAKDKSEGKLESNLCELSMLGVSALQVQGAKVRSERDTRSAIKVRYTQGKKVS